MFFFSQSYPLHLPYPTFADDYFGAAFPIRSRLESSSQTQYYWSMCLYFDSVIAFHPIFIAWRQVHRRFKRTNPHTYDICSPEFILLKEFLVECITVSNSLYLISFAIWLMISTDISSDNFTSIGASMLFSDWTSPRFRLWRYVLFVKIIGCK